MEMSKKMVFLKKSNFRKLIGGDLFVGGSKLAENLHARRGQHPPGFGGLGGGLIIGFYGGFMKGSKFGIGKTIFQSEAKRFLAMNRTFLSLRRLRPFPSESS